MVPPCVRPRQPNPEDACQINTYSGALGSALTWSSSGATAARTRRLSPQAAEDSSYCTLKTQCSPRPRMERGAGRQRIQVAVVFQGTYMVLRLFYGCDRADTRRFEFDLRALPHQMCRPAEDRSGSFAARAASNPTSPRPQLLTRTRPLPRPCEVEYMYLSVLSGSVYWYRVLLWGSWQGYVDSRQVKEGYG